MVEAEEHASEGAPEWMVSYADMITILMSFFVVMFSMAGNKDPKKEEPVIMSLRRQFGRFVGMPAAQYVPASSPLSISGGGSRLSPAPHETRTRGLIGDHPRVTTVRPGEQATVGGVIYFSDGTSDLNEAQERDLQGSAKELGGKPQKIEVRGHVASIFTPKGSPSRDNWDLAYQRAFNTAKYLISEGIDPRRIRIGVAAQYEPMYTGRDPLLLQKNGRVEIFMLNEFAQDLRETTDDNAP